MRHPEKIEVKGIGMGIADFFPARRIGITYKAGNGRDPLYFGNLEKEHAHCPDCSSSASIDGHLMFVVEIDKKRDEKEYSAGRAVLYCRHCGYGYDVKKGKETERLRITCLSGEKIL